MIDLTIYRYVAFVVGISILCICYGILELIKRSKEKAKQFKFSDFKKMK